MLFLIDVLFILLALFLSMENVYSMEKNEDEDAVCVARLIVLSCVNTNVKEQLNSKQPSQSSLFIPYPMLLNDLTEYLKTGVDPAYQGCKDSFKGVEMVLKDAGIVLSEKGNLRFLTAEEKLIDEFEFIGLEN